MYKTFFSLNAKPFDLLPNPDFLFLSRSHKKAMTYLDYAVRNRSGFVLLSGEVGSGKTTLIRDLFNKNHPKIVFSRVFNTKVDFEQLLAMINEDFGLPVASREKLSLLRELNDFLIGQFAQGNQTIVIIDEAQNLSPETLEELRLLSNLETDSAKLLHIILAGQPELRQMLAKPNLLQLRQRISCFCHILPLEPDEIQPYILQRLECAGNRQAADFSPEALEIIWRYSRGIPRLVNIFCDFLLLLAFADGEYVITKELAQAVAVDLEFETCYWGSADMQAVTAVGKGALPAALHSGASESHDETVKPASTAILNTVDRLEKSDHYSVPEAINADDVPHLKSRQAEADSVAAQTLFFAPAMTKEKKKGFFRFLFRAA